MTEEAASVDPRGARQSRGEADPQGARRTFALRVTASFFGSQVEETFVDRGRPVQIGNTEAMALPVPEGWPYLARVDWIDGRSVRVVDGEEQVYVVDPDWPLTLEVGPVHLHLEVTPRFLLRRTEDFQWWGSTAWLAVVLAATLLVQQGDLLYSNRCPWFGIDCPVADDGGVSGAFTAEYLARLLREDYAGADEGYIDDPDRRNPGDREHDGIYLPAGSEGPITDMGGAEETAPEEIRVPVPDEDDLAAEAAEEQEFELYADDDVGTPIEATPVEDSPDAIAEASPEIDGQEDDDPLRPAEDREGWGVQDWYDTEDRLLENLEIEHMLRMAQERLRIDPDDPSALSILSYYQYLAEDYDAALETYDRFIALYPDSSAGYNNKALVFKRLGEYEKEEGLYRVALALQPDDRTALNNLAVSLAHQGRFNEALAIMKRLETIDPGDPYADLHRSKIYAEMGEDEIAYEYLEQALQGMRQLDTLHHIEFRQDIRLDPSFEKLRQTRRFHAILVRYYGDDTPLQE